MRLRNLISPLNGERGWWTGIVLAVLAVAAAYVLRVIFNDVLDDGSPYIPFLLAVFFGAYFAGWRVGVLVALLSAVLSFYFPWDNRFSTTDWNGLALFLIASATLIYLTGLVSKRDRAVRAATSREFTLARELDLLIDSAVQHAICLLDREGKVVIWNAGAERLFGWTEKEVIGQYHSLFFSNEDVTSGEPVQELGEARKRGQSTRRGWRVRKDGSRFLAEAVLSRIDDDRGRLLGFGKVVRDITEEQTHSREIEAREMLMRSILSTVPDAMIVIDEHGIIQSFSAAAEKLFGYEEDEVVGQNVSLLMCSPDREEHDAYIKRYCSSHEKRVIGMARRVIGLRKDGSTFPHELTVGEANGGGKRLFTGFLRDLTEREAAEEQLQQLQAELIHISRVSAVGTMASTLAHELNQPLTAIANYVQTSAAVLADSQRNSDELVREALEEAGREALRAGAIVQRLREFVARGDMERKIEPVENLVRDACTLGTVGARVKGVNFTVDLAEPAGHVLVDPVQVQQVLLNLIRNSVEAMPDEGERRIDLSVQRDDDMMRFSVSDNGPGIDPNIAPLLFDAFVSTKSQGMGLGLSICRTIVEAHGGRIWAEPRPGGGTAFHFTLPCIEKEESHG
ncbi:MAG: PAS domain S-box protein [Sphingomonas sp.]|nr:PAS domain S-box protein [Sphingomonas sp.]